VLSRTLQYNVALQPKTKQSFVEKSDELGVRRAAAAGPKQLQAFPESLTRMQRKMWPRQSRWMLAALPLRPVRVTPAEMTAGYDGLMRSSGSTRWWRRMCRFWPEMKKICGFSRSRPEYPFDIGHHRSNSQSTSVRSMAFRRI